MKDTVRSYTKTHTIQISSCAWLEWLRIRMDFGGFPNISLNFNLFSIKSQYGDTYCGQNIIHGVLKVYFRFYFHQERQPHQLHISLWRYNDIQVIMNKINTQTLVHVCMRAPYVQANNQKKCVIVVVARYRWTTSGQTCCHVRSVLIFLQLFQGKPWTYYLFIAHFNVPEVYT